MKKVMVLVMVAALATAVSADVVSINFTQYTGAPNLIANGYGVEPANNWYNVSNVLGATDMTMSGGSASTVDINLSGVYVQFDTYTWDAPYANTTDRAAGSTYLNPVSINLTGLSGTFSSYDVLVYISGWNTTNGGSFSDGTDTYFMMFDGYGGAHAQSIDTNAGDGIDSGNYVRFSGLTADSTTITVSAAAIGAPNVGISAVQVVGEVVPEPATMTLLGLGSLVLLKRRK